MSQPLPQIHELPRQNASQVKNHWGDVVRLVRQSGSVAITQHATVEMVLLPAATYEQITRDLEALKSQQRSQIDELARRFEARLEGLQQPEASGRVDALLGRRGELAASHRPKAGTGY